jgi:hypothetical protein
VLFLEKVEKMESPYSCTFVVLRLDEMPLTLGVDSLMLHSPSVKMNPFHVIFYLNRILVVTHFDGGYHKAPSCTVILLLGLKEFL